MISWTATTLALLQSLFTMGKQGSREAGKNLNGKQAESQITVVKQSALLLKQRCLMSYFPYLIYFIYLFYLIILFILFIWFISFWDWKFQNCTWHGIGFSVSTAFACLVLAGARGLEWPGLIGLDSELAGYFPHPSTLNQSFIGTTAHRQHSSNNELLPFHILVPD